MKRLTTFLCLTLSLCLLSGCFVRNDDPIVQEADKAVQQVLDRLEELTDQTRNMTDEELSETIRGIAGEYHLTLNDEQMKFLLSALSLIHI